jgi:formylglycine-generating enzyme required for sulfatase activity
MNPRVFPHMSRRAFMAALPTPLLALQAREEQRAGSPAIIGGIEFRWCPAGKFVMGSPESEPDRRNDEAQVDVTLSRGFWMGRTEVTQGQWQRLVGDWPDQPPSPQFGVGNDYPLYWVNYAEALTFCARLTDDARRAGTLPDGMRVQLPTEAQWEYACRAGTTTAFAFGPKLDRTHANIAPRGAPRAAGNRGMPVGTHPANAWGLCDMHGNVFEWCRDWYHTRLPGGIDSYADKPGEPNRDGTYSRVRRGGAWNDGPEFCRSALRLRYEPERRSDHIGFRVMCGVS